ncbi:hypothetical protein VCR4J5_1570067 [Vibrio crassostreae]|uniref:Uncharacterized protein n=1 Tax=Vibrio crassostreae TaxID=246167 RepID=A0ABM9QQU2_9VIBR|nr:hypothetical protein VCR4J5_1570067 [Vibrio crassostreae]
MKCSPVSTTPKPVTLIAEVAVNNASVKLSPVTEKTGIVRSMAEGIRTPKKLVRIILGSEPLRGFSSLLSV